MIAFIDAHRDQFGVELICRILRAAIPGFLTSRGYRAAGFDRRQIGRSATSS